MRPKDNSDITMLIFSDYLEEIGEIAQAQEIRESLKENNQEKFFNIWSGITKYEVGTPTILSKVRTPYNTKVGTPWTYEGVGAESSNGQPDDLIEGTVGTQTS
jgi:hypothetical protein